MLQGAGVPTSTRGLRRKINLQINPRSDAGTAEKADHLGMTTTDYLINGLFVLLVLRQARERRLDLRGLLGPLAAVFFVGQLYIHTLPSYGNDLAFIFALASLGIMLGVLCGLATHVRAADGLAFARVGWLAAALLIVGIASRMVFAFALSHGAEPAVRTFSIAHHISAAAWPVALVSMAICEVTARLLVVEVRGRRARTMPSLVALAA